jgi:hypothetical protein
MALLALGVDDKIGPGVDWNPVMLRQFHLRLDVVAVDVTIPPGLMVDDIFTKLHGALVVTVSV